MLESIRNATQGFVGKAIMTVVMGLIIVSFVIWGVGDMLRGFTSSTVASVGSAKISAQEFHYAYQRTLQQYQRRLRQPFTNEQARAIGLDRQVLQRLLSEAAIDEEARKLGLSISQDALRGLVTSNPAFQNKSGAFDPERFVSVLRDNDMNEQTYVSELHKSAVRQFIFAALTTGLAAPKAETKAEADTDGQTRSVDYFVLPAAAAGDIPAPSEDALKAFFNDRKSSYRAPEFRSMDVVALEPQTLANPAEVSDADAEAAYARVAGKDPRFGSPEKRDLEQILFPNQAEADAAAAKIKAGATFDDIVKERNMKPEDAELGETTKDAIIDKSEADAVFALPQGGVSGVLSSQFGPVIVRVKSITPSTIKPYAEVAEEIKRQVSASRAGDKIQAVHDKIEDARVSGKSLAEAAKAAGLTTETVAAVDAQGQDPSGKPVNLPDKTDLLRDGLRLRRRARRSAAADPGQRLCLVRRDQDRAVARPLLRGSQARGRGAVAGRADRQGARGQGGRSRQADPRRRERGQRRQERRRGGQVRRRHPSGRQDGLPESVVAAIFREPADGSGSAATPDGRAVFKITADRTPAVDFADLRVKAMAEKLDGAVRDSLLDQYIAALRRSLGVTVHDNVLQSAEGS